MANARVTQAPVLAFGSGGGAARVTQSALLVLAPGDSSARVTQSAVLVLVPAAAKGSRVTQGLGLVLAQADLNARLTQAAVLVLCRSVPCLTRWAECWRIERKDGQVFTFTSLDRSIKFRGETYSPCDSLSASAHELAASLGSIGNMELAGIISDDSITEEDLFGGLFDGAEVEVWMVPWSNASGEVPWRLAKGTTGNMSQGDTGFTMEVLTPGALLQQQALLQTYTPSCRYDLGDDRCTVDLDSLTVTGTVTAVAEVKAANAASRRIFSDSSRTEDDGYFELGTVTWTSGKNKGARSEVKSFDGDSGKFTLWQPMLHPIEVGDEYTAAPGCDKSPATCKTKFDNFVNFGGFPDVPGRDAISQSPDSK